MKRENWKVIEGDNRPAGPRDRCFYCRVEHGGQHRPECVIRTRTVVVSTIIERVIEVPESWDAEEIEFYRNEGSRCASSDFDELAALSSRLDKSDECACSLITTKYVREATEEDERMNVWPQNDPHQEGV